MSMNEMGITFEHNLLSSISVLWLPNSSKKNNNNNVLAMKVTVEWPTELEMRENEKKM